MAERDKEDTKSAKRAPASEEEMREWGWFKRTLYRLTTDDLFLESFFNSMGACVNLVLAVLNGYNGFTNHNPWSLSMALYFVVLGLITLYMAFCIGRPQGRSAPTVMRQCGVCLLILGIALASFMYLYVIRHELMEVSVGLAWALTILTVGLFAVAIFNTFRFRRSDLVRHAFQRVALASSVGGLVLLEIQLLATLGKSFDLAVVVAIETVTAVAALAILVAFGVSILVKADSAQYPSL